MTQETESYLAYMLRLWRVDDSAGPVWRASLESPHSGERRAFADLEFLFGFLQERTEASSNLEKTEEGEQ
jgi:hypothetical protein